MIAITIINSMSVKPDSLRGLLLRFIITSSVFLNGENAAWFRKEPDPDPTEAEILLQGRYRRHSPAAIRTHRSHGAQVHVEWRPGSDEKPTHSEFRRSGH